MSDQLHHYITVFSYSCTCVVEGCGWFAGGNCGSRAEADKMGAAVLKSHLATAHGIVNPRTKTVPKGKSPQ